jgi:hypothetical protein
MKNITKNEAIELIKGLAGNSIYSVKFIKKDGSERLMNSIRRTQKGVSGEGLKFDADAKGLMPVYDLQLAKSGVEEKKCWRMVNFETVFEVKTNGEVYKIV